MLIFFHCIIYYVGANPLSCVAAAETLDIIKEEKIQDHAHVLGKHVGAELTRMMEKHSDLCIDVRGKGLMWGLQLDHKFASEIYETMKDKKILVGLGGSKKDVLRVMPPMCLTKADIDKFIDVLDDTLENWDKGDTREVA